MKEHIPKIIKEKSPVNLCNFAPQIVINSVFSCSDIYLE